MNNNVRIVTFIGKPNVGKSSMFNAFFQYNAAITSPKPQTTRWNLKSIFRSNEQVIGLIDTPGIHLSKNLLDDFLNKQARKSLHEADIIFWLSDLSQPLDQNDENIIKIINSLHDKKLVVCLTKDDLVDKTKIQVRKTEIKQQILLPDIFFLTINIKENDLRAKILQAINHFVIDNHYENLPATWANSEDDDLIIQDKIREACIHLLRHEIPYGIDVTIEEKKYDYQTKSLFIYACVIVEKESHKKIIIGKNGQTIKNIGIRARMNLLKIYDCKVHLKLFVKIRKNWRNNVNYLQNTKYKS